MMLDWGAPLTNLFLTGAVKSQYYIAIAYTYDFNFLKYRSQDRRWKVVGEFEV